MTKIFQTKFYVSENLSYYNTRSPSLGRTVSPQAIYVDVDTDKDTKCYHLVSQDLSYTCHFVYW